MYSLLNKANFLAKAKLCYVLLLNKSMTLLLVTLQKASVKGTYTSSSYCI